VRILVACEFSGVVRRAFAKYGHEAWSCDLLPSLDNSPMHITGDVLPLLKQKWDMVLAFPSCTHLAVSGAKHFAAKRADGRQQAGIKFFMEFTELECEQVVIENPVGIMSTEYRKPDCIVQPYEHGDPATKTTCLWISKGMKKLVPTNIVSKGERHITKSGRSLPKWYNLPPSADRGSLRSVMFPGIANAMADLWGNPMNDPMF
jgi:hypothetical protein